MSDSEHTYPLFEPVAHASLADAVVEQIESLIVSSILKQGHRLPSERDLSEMLGVSRPKLREALGILEARGLVKPKHGEGTFVAELTGQAMLPALLSLYGRHEAAFFDYIEYRREQEGFAARLAASRATKADKARVEEVLDACQNAWDAKDLEAELAADIALHTAIVDASQNATLIHMMGSIYELTRERVFYNRSHLRAIDGAGRTLLTQHVEIGQAVLSGQADQAEAAARAHMDFVEASVRFAMAQQRREALAEKRRLLAE